MTIMMRAAAMERFGPPEVLQTVRVPTPHVTADQVLVRVINAGVQLTDAAIRAGWTPPGSKVHFPQILGNEFSGVVIEVGHQVSGLAPGDEVAGFNVFGCYAEYVAVPRSQVVRKPAHVRWETAGALSASGQTAHTAMEDLRVAAGEVVLVHGAAGGVGSMFTQLAINRGATVIGTASSRNHPYLRSLGAVPIEYGAGQLGRARAAAPRIDVAFDAAGHQNLRTSIELVTDRRRVATIVDMALAQELGCRIIRSRRSAERLTDLLNRIAEGSLDVHIRHRYSLDEVAQAHHDVESGHGRGKNVLEIGHAQ